MSNMNYVNTHTDSQILIIEIVYLDCEKNLILLISSLISPISVSKWFKPNLVVNHLELGTMV